MRIWSLKQVLSIMLSGGLITNCLAVTISSDVNNGQITYASQKIRDSFTGDTLKESVVTFAIDSSLAEQSYLIRSIGNQIQISGGDSSGLMYGGLEIAERARLKQQLSGLSITNKPFIKRRGLKFNIPLDARSPSYDDSGTAAIENIKEVWSKEFWHEFLDSMADNRYNTLTLWCNHPFTTMLKLDEYPDVAIDDVAVPTYKMDDHILPQYFESRLQNPANYKVIKKMPIEEKIKFWQHVMRYAKERGVDIYFITWNIWAHGAEGKYGITTNQTNDKTIAYMRESMKQFVLTYPDLKGFGITAGEHMKNKLEGDYEVEKWLWNTYGQGIVDAKAVDPKRTFHFIHRVWYSGMDKMMNDFVKKYPDRIDFGFKYAKARLYSISNPPFFKNEFQKELERFGVGCWMNLRNDDIYHFRWGNPDYVRDYMKNLPPEPLLAGYHMGSDGYVWGREFTSTEPDSPRQLEVKKHWYKFMMWGRLGYDPSLSRSFFEEQLRAKFPSVSSPKLYETWQTASKIVPYINTAHWRHWDHMWSVETCMSKKEGYHSVDHFIEYGPLKGQGMLSISDYVKNPDAEGINPFQVAGKLDVLGNETLQGVKALRAEAVTMGKELRRTLSDMEAFAHLAFYYADKFRGSTDVYRFRMFGKESDKLNSIKHLEAAVVHWKEYGRIASSLYTTQLLARVSYTDWNKRLLQYAKDDVQLAKDAKHTVFPPSVHHKLHKIRNQNK